MGQLVLAWHNCSIEVCSIVSPGEIAEGSHILVKIWEKLLGTWLVAPVSHQFSRNGKEAQSLDTSRTHTVIGVISKPLVHGTRCFGVGVNFVAFLDEGQGEECSAHISHNTSYDDLGSPCSSNGGPEILVVPGIDFTISSDNGGIRVLSDDFSRKWSVGAGFCRGVSTAGKSNTAAMAL